ncbi:MAG: enolase C-terminal domain-like protein [Kiritimatiellia bacterium]
MLHWFSYRLALKHPLTLPGLEPISHRCGVLIHNTETGGWGDAAPLPGYSRETLDEVLSVLERGDAAASRFPSLRFALECAAVPFNGPSAAVPVNALWLPNLETLDALCVRLEDWNSPVVKIKPGREPDLDAIRAVLRARPDAKLRLDGNRQWSIKQLRTVVESLPRNALDYVEEPLSDQADYALLDFHCPVALDESLLFPEGKELAEKPFVTALVLKPTLMGNAEDRAFWVDVSKRRGCQLTWSSAFESGVGLWHLARLAEGGTAAGLDTGSIFVDDPVSPRPLVTAGFLAGNTAFTVEGNRTLNFELHPSLNWETRA